LPQEISIEKNLDLNIINYLEKETGIMEIKERMRELENNLDEETKLLKYGEFREQYENLNGYTFESLAKRILSGFGLDQYISKKVKELSGGEKSKLAFVSVLLKKPDILLLDEPTNNLDFQSMFWLENFIKKSNKGYLIVSHDRKFLDNTVEGVIQIRPDKKDIVEESGDYSHFIERREKELNKKKEKYQKAQEKIDRLQKTVDKRDVWAKKGAKQKPDDKDKYLRGYRRDRSAKLNIGTKELGKKIEKIKEETEQPQEKNSLRMELIPNQETGKNSIQLTQVKAGYKDGFSLEQIDLNINYGERVILVGNNGAGKTTLLKTISGDIKPLSGNIKLSKGLNIGNFMQHHDNLDFNKTIFSYLKENSDSPKQEIYRILDYFNFDTSQSDKKIKGLSQGERARLILAKFSAQKVNMLILDEPTNHLDIESMQVLEESLKNYTGTIIIASHDRYFLKKINPDRFYLLKNNKIEYLPDYENYINSIKRKSKESVKQIENRL